MGLQEGKGQGWVHLHFMNLMHISKLKKSSTLKQKYNLNQSIYPTLQFSSNHEQQKDINTC